jgi:hypothetical protein
VKRSRELGEYDAIDWSWRRPDSKIDGPASSATSVWV